MTVLEVYATQKYTFWGDMLALSEARGLEKEGRAIFFSFLNYFFLSVPTLYCLNVCTSLLMLLCAVKSSCCGIHGDRPTQLAELPRSKFDPELFSHSAYVKLLVTFATKVPYLAFCDKMRQSFI